MSLLHGTSGLIALIFAMWKYMHALDVIEVDVRAVALEVWELENKK